MALLSVELLNSFNLYPETAKNDGTIVGDVLNFKKAIVSFDLEKSNL